MLAFNSTPSQVQTALAGLADIGTNRVEVAGPTGSGIGGTATLKRLEHDPDPGVALKAAFALTTASKDPWTPTAVEEAQTFATLLEARTQLKPPAWWIRVFSKRESFGGPDNLEPVGRS